MAHALTVKHKRFKIEITPEECLVLDQPFFCQNHNYRTVIGIYPTAYDYSTPEQPERKGYIYHCYRVESDHKRVQYHEVPDWFLTDLDDGKLKGSVADLIQIIVFNRDYAAAITEDSFIERLTLVIREVVPDARLKVSFKPHPHLKRTL